MNIIVVLLQIVGAALVVASAVLWFGTAAGLCVGGVCLFGAGLAHERGW